MAIFSLVNQRLVNQYQTPWLGSILGGEDVVSVNQETSASTQRYPCRQQTTFFYTVVIYTGCRRGILRGVTKKL